MGIEIEQHEFINLDCAEAEAEITRLRAENERLKATTVELRQIIVDSAYACTLRGCEHCKWLGWHLGRYESLAALAGRPT